MEAHHPPCLRHGADSCKSRGHAERRCHHRARCGHCAGRRRGPHRGRVSRQGYPGPPRNRPKRSFSVHLNRADLLIVNGQGLEMAWLPTALAESTNARIREGKPGYLDASIGAALIPYDPADVKAPLLIRGLVALQSVAVSKPPDRTAGYNHHYWLDPANGNSTAKAILDKLVLLHQSNATVFK